MEANADSTTDSESVVFTFEHRHSELTVNI